MDDDKKISKEKLIERRLNKLTGLGKAFLSHGHPTDGVTTHSCSRVWCDHGEVHAVVQLYFEIR